MQYIYFQEDIHAVGLTRWRVSNGRLPVLRYRNSCTCKSQVSKMLKIQYLNDDVENSRSYEKFKISTAGS